MDLQPDEQSLLIRQSLDRFLEKRLPFEERAKQRGAEHFLEFWRSLESEIGIAAAGLPESAGGFGIGAEAEMVVARSLGTALAVTPYIPSMVLAADVLGRLGASQILQQIAAGSTFVVAAVEEPATRGDVALTETWADPIEDGWKLHGRKVAVDFGAQADRILLPARISDGDFALFSIDPAQLGNSLKSLRLIDDTPVADIILDGFVAPGDALIAQGPEVLSALQSAIDRATAALCAEAAGIATQMVEDTVTYTKEREQFGVAIASFQALQHRMVDMWAKAQEIDAASLLATLKTDEPAAISAAKATVSINLRHIGQEAVQLHGAMGLTEELRVGHYFKRATALENKLGNADYHVERYRQLTA